MIEPEGRIWGDRTFTFGDESITVRGWKDAEGEGGDSTPELKRLFDQHDYFPGIMFVPDEQEEYADIER